MSGSGGTAGSVKYADYLENAHESFIIGGSGNFAGYNYRSALLNAWDVDPYDKMNYQNPSSMVSAIDTQWTALNTAFGAYDEEADYQAAITKAVAEIDKLGVLKNIDVGAISTASRAGAGDVLTAIDGIISTIDLDPESTTARANAVLTKDAVIGSYLDWSAAIDTVVAKLATASPDINPATVIGSLFADITLADLYTLVENRIASLISDVITKAFDAVSPTLLQDLVDAFETQRENERARIRTRFKAAASFRGAGQSSAYALGLALVDSDFSKETTQFQTQANLQLYQQGIETYNNLLGTYLGAGAQVEISNRTERTRFASAATITNKQQKDNFLTSNAVQKLTNDIQKKQTDLGVFVEAFRTELTSRLQAKLGDTQADSAKINAYVEAFAQEMRLRGGAAVAEKQSRDRMLEAGVNNILAYRQFLLTTQAEIVNLRGELSRLQFVMTQEYTGDQIDRNLAAATYQIGLIQKGVPVLGALGGGTALPDKPSKVGSALGGALGGAVKGGMAGGLPGAIGGLALGGLAGAFGG